MSIVERLLDKIVAKTEVVDEFELNIAGTELTSYIHSIIDVLDYKIVKNNPNQLLLQVKGRTVSQFDFDSLIRNDPSFEKLNKAKSKLEITINQNSVKISSFEHILCTKNEKELFKLLLKKRLEVLKIKLKYGEQ